MPLSQRRKAILIALIPLVLLFSLGVAVFVRVYRNSLRLQLVADPTRRIQIVATIYPLGDFARNITQGIADVTTITPPGVEPHDYQPTPQDLVKLYKADIVIVNGNGVDAWADKLVDDLRKKGVRTVRMSDEIASLPDEGAGSDPHFWLDPISAVQAVETISWPLLVDAREVDAQQMMIQKEVYHTRLEALDREYTLGLARCERHEIVTSHNAFRYLAKRYNLTNLYILGLSPEEDPSPQKIAEVATLAREKGIKTIFFETLVNPKLSQTIADEIGAKTAVLNPLEGLTEEELQSGKDYITVMQENLVNLRTALTCT